MRLSTFDELNSYQHDCDQERRPQYEPQNEEEEEEQEEQDVMSEMPSPTMSSSWKLLRILWFVSFLLNFKPSEPYLARYLMEVKGLTEDELDHQVWPWSTYGSLFFLIPVGFIAGETVSSSGHRYVVIGGLICREFTRLLLLFADGTFWMATMQCTYAGSVATNTIFFAYAYFIVDPKFYSIATALMYACYHSGNLMASILGQVLVSSCGVELRSLFFISWVATSLAALLFVVLVPAPKMNASSPSTSYNFSLLRRKNIIDAVNDKVGTRSAPLMLIHEVQGVYALPIVRWVSIWRILIGSSTNLAMNIFQTYFYSLDPKLPAGAIEAVLELILATTAAVVALPFVSRLLIKQQREQQQQQENRKQQYISNCDNNHYDAFNNNIIHLSNEREEELRRHSSTLLTKNIFQPKASPGSAAAEICALLSGSSALVALLYAAGLLIASLLVQSTAWKATIPIILAMGTSAGQIALASAVIACAVSYENISETNRKRGDGENDESATGTSHAAAIIVAGRCGLIFPFNKFIELCITSILMMFCGTMSDCSSSGYLWLASFGQLIAAFVASVAFWSLPGENQQP